jgi:hypothetical protein
MSRVLAKRVLDRRQAILKRHSTSEANDGGERHFCLVADPVVSP